MVVLLTQYVAVLLFNYLFFTSWGRSKPLLIKGFIKTLVGIFLSAIYDHHLFHQPCELIISCSLTVTVFLYFLLLLHFRGLWVHKFFSIPVKYHWIGLDWMDIKIKGRTLFYCEPHAFHLVPLSISILWFYRLLLCYPSTWQLPIEKKVSFFVF